MSQLSPVKLAVRWDQVPSHLAAITEAIRTNGCVRLTDTQIDGDPVRFRRLIQSVVGDSPKALMPYLGGTNDRKDVSGGLGVLDVGTEPPHLRLQEHNEMCYMDHWPALFCIGCLEQSVPATHPAPPPPMDRGVTTFTDNVRATRWVQERHPKFFDRLLRHGTRVVRNFPDENTRKKLGGQMASAHSGHTTWQTSFYSSDRAAVDAQLRQSNFDATWIDDGHGGVGLKCSNHRAAILALPAFDASGAYLGGGEKDAASLGDDSLKLMWHNLWSNNAWFRSWQPYCDVPLEQRPYYSVWGDTGEPTSDEELLTIQAAHWEGGRLAVEPWQAGEVVLADNHRVGHGRMPYDPSVKRRMAVLLADPVTRVNPSDGSGLTFGRFDNAAVAEMPYRDWQ